MNWRSLCLATVVVGACAVLSYIIMLSSPAVRCIREGSALVDGKRYICVEYPISE